MTFSSWVCSESAARSLYYACSGGKRACNALKLSMVVDGWLSRLRLEGVLFVRSLSGPHW